MRTSKVPLLLRARQNIAVRHNGGMAAFSSMGSGGGWGRRRVTGLVLLMVAGWALLDRYTVFNAQLAVPLLLGVIFTGWSLVAREWGLLVPGGILTGIGAGVLFVRTTALSRVGDSGWFLLCFAGGWVLITVLSATHFQRRVLWPLIPAGVLGVIGAAHLAGPGVQRGLHAVQDFWPWALLAVAAWLLLVRGRR